jgi:dTDP-4-amino-4,6-dideoxygalactose transaminase
MKFKNKINFHRVIVNHRNNIKKYSLLDDAFSKQDLIEGINVILSKKITMSKITSIFEKNFAKSIGSKYAVMVNS